MRQIFLWFILMIAAIMTIPILPLWLVKRILELIHGLFGLLRKVIEEVDSAIVDIIRFYGKYSGTVKLASYASREAMKRIK